MSGRTAAEAAMALAAAGFGGIVVAGALQHDTGWGATGPGAGYFPLRIGILLIAAALLLAGRALVAAVPGRFSEPGALRRVVALFVPTALFGVAIAPLGTYLPMFVYLLWMSRVQARAGWPLALAFAIGTPLAFFLLFETWLTVPLAKGPVEEWLGIY
jgi:hypothetical protein